MRQTGEVNLTNREYELLRNLIYKTSGIHLGDKKQSLVAGRLFKIIRQNGFTNFKQYYDYIISDKSGKALNTLINRISTNHTFFYRENDHFGYFSKQVLPELKNMLEKKIYDSLRFWSAGCASGEEAYTLAMLVMEFFGDQLKKWKVRILATDISETALRKAMSGIYKQDNVNRLPSHLKFKYFKSIGNREWQVIDEVKKLVLFRRLNLIQTIYPFKRKFHSIFCRNVMIYFDPPTRKCLITRLHRFMEPESYLFIGHSENLSNYQSLFQPVHPAIYKKKEINGKLC